MLFKRNKHQNNNLKKFRKYLEINSLKKIINAFKIINNLLKRNIGTNLMVLILEFI